MKIAQERIETGIESLGKPVVFEDHFQDAENSRRLNSHRSVAGNMRRIHGKMHKNKRKNCEKQRKEKIIAGKT